MNIVSIPWTSARFSFHTSLIFKQKSTWIHSLKKRTKKKEKKILYILQSTPDGVAFVLPSDACRPAATISGWRHEPELMFKLAVATAQVSLPSLAGTVCPPACARARESVSEWVRELCGSGSAVRKSYRDSYRVTWPRMPRPARPLFLSRRRDRGRPPTLFPVLSHLALYS